jgi:predicted DNA repair protein MutK
MNNIWINARLCSVKGKSLVQRVTWLCDVISVVGMAIRLWAGKEGFESLPGQEIFLFTKKDQTGSGAHPAAYSMTPASFARVNR